MAQDWEGSVAAHKARYRERIIDAAVELVADAGVAGLSMVGLAQRAGIGRATLYKYFPDVEHVLLAHLERELDRYAQHLRAALERHDDAAQRLHAYVATLLHYFASEEHERTGARFDQAGLSAAAMETLERHQAKLYDPLIATLADGVAAGVFRANLDPALHARLILGALGELREELLARRLTPEAAVDVAWLLLTDGLLTRAVSDDHR